MRTRCPGCNTVFRVTSEQLRLKAGKVRCGSCQTVFNAFDELVSEANEPLIAAPVAEESAPRDDPLVPEFEPVDEELTPREPDVDQPVESEAWPEDAFEGEAAPEPDVELETAAFYAVEAAPIDAAEDSAYEPPLDDMPESGPEPTMDVEQVPGEIVAEPIDHAAEQDLPQQEPQDQLQEPLAEPLVESPEESTQAARQAGLVAARELIDSGSFSRWSAGTLASDSLGGFTGESTQRAVWPFVMVAVLLCIGLIGQILFYFRTDVVLRFPAMAGLYELVGADIPLPRNAALVSIETSDLQSDNARGLFVLQATLKNRASYGQAWPALELSLTDTSDAVVSRRVMFAADYLPPGTTSDTFPASGEMPVKLWIEARESGASGYRLYIFYP